MIPDAIEIRLTPKERAELEGRLRAGTTQQRQLLRIRIVLEAAEGTGTREIARWLETTPTTVSLWRRAPPRSAARSSAQNRPAPPSVADHQVHPVVHAQTAAMGGGAQLS